LPSELSSTQRENEKMKKKRGRDEEEEMGMRHDHKKDTTNKDKKGALHIRNPAAVSTLKSPMPAP